MHAADQPSRILPDVVHDTLKRQGAQHNGHHPRGEGERHSVVLGLRPMFLQYGHVPFALFTRAFSSLRGLLRVVFNETVVRFPEVLTDVRGRVYDLARCEEVVYCTGDLIEEGKAGQRARRGDLVCHFRSTGNLLQVVDRERVENVRQSGW